MWDFVPLFTVWDYVLRYFVRWDYVRVNFIPWDFVMRDFVLDSLDTHAKLSSHPALSQNETWSLFPDLVFGLL